MLSRAKVQVRPTKVKQGHRSSKAKDQAGSKIKQDQRPTMFKQSQQLSSKTINGQVRPTMVKQGRQWSINANQEKGQLASNVPPWVFKWSSYSCLPGLWFNHFQNHVPLTKVNSRTSVHNGGQKGSCLCNIFLQNTRSNTHFNKIISYKMIKVTQINYVSRNQLHSTTNLNFGLMGKKAKHCWALSTNFLVQFSW